MAAIDDFFRTSITALYTLYALAGIALIVALAFAVRAFFRSYLHYHGTRLVTCPETEQWAAVEPNARQAAVSSLFGAPEVRLDDCSRWPERQDCPQDCVWQIDVSPVGCSLRRMLNSWY